MPWGQSRRHGRNRQAISLHCSAFADGGSSSPRLLNDELPSLPELFGSWVCEIGRCGLVEIDSARFVSSSQTCMHFGHAQ